MAGATGTGRMIGRYTSSPKPIECPFGSFSPIDAKSLAPLIVVESEIPYQVALREINRHKTRIRSGSRTHTGKYHLEKPSAFWCRPLASKTKISVGTLPTLTTHSAKESQGSEHKKKTKKQSHTVTKSRNPNRNAKKMPMLSPTFDHPNWRASSRYRAV